MPTAAQTPENDVYSRDVWRAGAEEIELEDLSKGVGLDDDEELETKVEDVQDEEADAADADDSVAEDDAESSDEESASEQDDDADSTEPGTADESDAGSETEEADADSKAPIMIPKARLDQETAKRRAVENQLAELQAIQARARSGKDTPEETREALSNMDLELGDLPKQMFDKVLDGNIDEANTLFASMITKAAQKAAQLGAETARNELPNVVNQQKQQSAEDAVITTLEESYAFYNPASDAFDQEAIAETVAMQQAFVGKGYTRADAMQKAADYYIRMRKETHPEDFPEPETKPPAPKPKATRKPEEVKRNVAAKKGQPPAVAGSRGNNTEVNDALDIRKLSQEEFDALPADTLKRLRGDYV